MVGDKDDEQTPREPRDSLWDEPPTEAIDNDATQAQPTLDVGAPAPTTAEPAITPTFVAPEQPSTLTISVTPIVLLGVLAAVMLIVGSIGPWVAAGPFSVSGSAGDGLITLVAGVVALVPAALGRWPGLVLAAALLAAAVTIYDLARIIPITGDSDFIPVTLGWGLVLATIASLGLLVLALISVSKSASPPVAIASGAIAGVIVVALIALGGAGAFDEEQINSDDTVADIQEPTPTPAPTPTDGLSTESCRTAGITTTGTKAGPCQSDSSGQVVWVAPRGRAATLDGISAAVESIRTAEVIDPGDGYSDPISPEGTFVIARIRVKNTGTAPFDLQDGNFGLNAGGSLYEPTDDSDLAMLDDQLAGGKSLGPGLTRRGNVIFDIPRSRIAAIRASGVVVVAPPAYVDEYDEDVRLTIRLAFLQTRGSVRAAGTPSSPGGGPAVAPAPEADPAPADPSLKACDQNISAASATTCDFASETFKAYAAEIQAGSSTSVTVTAYSAAAGSSIDMDCVDIGGDVTCTGRTAAYVTFPLWAAEVY